MKIYLNKISLDENPFFFTNAIHVNIYMKKDLIIFEVYFGKPFNFTIMASDIKINVKLKAMFKYQHNIIYILFVLW